MDKDNPPSTPATSRRRRLMLTAALVLSLLAAAGIAGYRLSGGNGPAPAVRATFTAKKGPLTISVIESGTIKARDQIIIKNEVEGKTSIISLVPEGTLVNPGDLLVELDGSALQDQKIDQEIRVQNADAARINAQEGLAVARNQTASDIDKAKLTLKFAEQDLKQYQEGEFPNSLAAARNRITLAQEELTRARETLKWSQTLFDEKYISQTELQADLLAEKRKALDLDLAKNDLELLENFTYQRRIAQLESDVSQARMALERTLRKASADIIQAEADLKAKTAEYNRQKEKLAKLQDQITKTRITAPAAGLVIYATSARRGGRRHNVEPLAEGQQVLERQELIYLPTTDSAMAEIAVHETNLKKVAKGLRATVTVDALPNRKFSGTVAQIAPLPNAESMWMNPDLKVYNTEIFLDDTDVALRTGMSCLAEIIVAHYPEAVFLPVQAVLRVGGEPTVFVVDDSGVSPRQVVAGLDNNRMIHILQGIAPGEKVLLTPPLAAGAVPSAKASPPAQPAMETQGPQSQPPRQIATPPSGEGAPPSTGSRKRGHRRRRQTPGE